MNWGLNWFEAPASRSPGPPPEPGRCGLPGLAGYPAALGGDFEGGIINLEKN